MAKQSDYEIGEIVDVTSEFQGKKTTTFGRFDGWVTPGVLATIGFIQCNGGFTSAEVKAEALSKRHG